VRGGPVPGGGGWRRAGGAGQEGLRTDIFVRNSPRELIDVVLRRPERGHLPRGAARGARRVSSARAARAPGPSDLAPPTPSLSPARFYIGHPLPFPCAFLYRAWGDPRTGCSGCGRAGRARRTHMHMHMHMHTRTGPGRAGRGGRTSRRPTRRRRGGRPGRAGRASWCRGRAGSAPAHSGGHGAANPRTMAVMHARTRITALDRPAVARSAAAVASQAPRGPRSPCPASASTCGRFQGSRTAG